VRGSLEDAIPFLERGLGLCRTWNLRFLLPMVISSLGTAYTFARRLAEALPLLEEGTAQAPGVWNSFLTTRVDLATGYLASGRTEEAAGLVGHAIELATERKSRGVLGQALRLLGEIQSARALEHSRAEDCFRKALTIAEELGMRPLAARCHAGLALLYRRINGQKQAEKHIATAEAMYGEMNMNFWLQKMHADMREIR